MSFGFNTTHDSVPLYVTISKWVKTFRETNAATLVRVVGRKRSVLTAANREKLRAAVEVTLTLSTSFFVTFLAQYSTSNVKA